MEHVVSWVKKLDLSEDFSDLIRAEHITGLALEIMTSKDDWKEIGVKKAGDNRTLANAVRKLFEKERRNSIDH